MHITLTAGDATSSTAEALVLPISWSAAGFRHYWWAPGPQGKTNHVALNWMDRMRFRANVAEVLAVPSNRNARQAWILTGLGLTTEVEPARILKAVSAGIRQARDMRCTSVDVVIRPCLNAPLTQEELVRLAIRGIFTGGYFLRSPPAQTVFKKVRVVVPRVTPQLKAIAREEIAAGPVMERVRVLANLPPNRATPDGLDRLIRALVQRHPGIRLKVHTASALRRLKCGALLAVGQGSRHPPRLLELHHPGNRRGQPVVLIGKTITFDSGGLSLKTARGMEWMRYDKCGGMAVLAALVAAHATKIRHPVIALLPVAENMPGGASMRPGDVAVTRSGKSVQILNTDAEGRLVLADALDLAGRFKPRAIVDLATLTGAAQVALGHPYSALFGRPAAYVQSLRQAGDAAGEKVWPMPLHADYEGMLSTPFADLKNTGDGTAGAIAGAMFLQRFVPEGVPWCHIDLTQAWLENATSHAPAGANLFGAYLLLDWLRNLEPRP